MPTRVLSALLLALLPLGVSSIATAQEPPPPEADTRQDEPSSAEIDELRAKIRALEKRVNSQEGPPAPPASAFSMDKPRAGYASGIFFIRSADDNYIFIPSLRGQFDFFAFAPNQQGGAGSLTIPKDQFVVRRIRPELNGTLFRRVDFAIHGEFAGTRAQVADAYIIVNYDPWVSLQVGQFDLPFSYENRVSDKFLDFMERSNAVRNLGTPNKDVGGMIFGGPRDNLFYYSTGIFNGEGQSAERSWDNNFVSVGRAFVRPLARAHVPFWLEKLQLGGSWAYGITRSNPNQVAGFSTQGTFFPSSAQYFPTAYTAGDLKKYRVEPEGAQRRVAGELIWPFGNRLALKFELVDSSLGTKEALDSAPNTPTRINGKISGYGYYASLSWFVVGERSIVPEGGFERFPRLEPYTPPSGRPQRALELLFKYEQMRTSYKSGQANAGTPASSLDGDYHYDAFEFGANYWLTKHVRLTMNYVLDHFGAQSHRYDLNDAGNPKSNFFHEFLFRFAVAL